MAKRPQFKWFLFSILWIVCLLLGIISPTYADYFASQSGYISIGTSNVSSSLLIVGTTTMLNTYLSVGQSLITAPSITVDNATSITMTSARLNARVIEDGGDTSVDVRFGIGTSSLPSANFTDYTYISNWLTGYHNGSKVYLDKTGLGSGTTYYYRAQVRNSSTNATSANETSFTTISTIGNALNLMGIPSNTSIILTWTKASGSRNTIIRYRTDTYPSSVTDGTSAYNGTGYQCTVSGLTAGQTYYFAAWGAASSPPYSVTEGRLVMSTPAVPAPSGGEKEPTVILPIPNRPEGAMQEPDISGFQLEPFTGIIKYFNTGTGGLGMPEKYAWETLFILCIAAVGFFAYIRMRNFFIAFALVFVLSCAGWGMHLTQGYLVYFEVIIGAGVWAIDHYMQ